MGQASNKNELACPHRLALRFMRLSLSLCLSIFLVTTKQTVTNDSGNVAAKEWRVEEDDAEKNERIKVP